MRDSLTNLPATLFTLRESKTTQGPALHRRQNHTLRPCNIRYIVLTLRKSLDTHAPNISTPLSRYFSHNSSSINKSAKISRHVCASDQDAHPEGEQREPKDLRTAFLIDTHVEQKMRSKVAESTTSPNFDRYNFASDEDANPESEQREPKDLSRCPYHTQARGARPSPWPPRDPRGERSHIEENQSQFEKGKTPAAIKVTACSPCLPGSLLPCLGVSGGRGRGGGRRGRRRSR